MYVACLGSVNFTSGLFKRLEHWFLLGNATDKGFCGKTKLGCQKSFLVLMFECTYRFGTKKRCSQDWAIQGGLLHSNRQNSEIQILLPGKHETNWSNVSDICSAIPHFSDNCHLEEAAGAQLSGHMFSVGVRL